MASNNSPQKKRRGFFDDFFTGFGIDDDFEADLAQLQARMNQLMHEGMIATEQGKRSGQGEGPFVYGFSMRVGPDGKPVFNQFGNVPKKAKQEPAVTAEREPLVDVITRENEIAVIAEVPGIEKKDIKLKATADSLSIDVDTKERKYSKKIALSERILPNSARASYKNGLLEVTLRREKHGKAFSGKVISVE